MESYGKVTSYENDWELDNRMEYDCYSEQPYENIIYMHDMQENKRKNEKIKGKSKNQ